MNMKNDIIQGYLYKESKTFKTRKRRWMVLRGNQLHSYKNDKINKLKPTESFDLAIYHKIKVCSKDRFELLADTDTRAFIAPNPDVLTEWIRRIGEVQKKLQNLKTQSQSLKTVITQTEIIEQLKAFGYAEQDIMSAIDSSVDKSNINDILKLIKQKQQKEQTTSTKTEISPLPNEVNFSCFTFAYFSFFCINFPSERLEIRLSIITITQSIAAITNFTKI